MCNSIFLGAKTIPEAEDGEEVEVMVKGVYHTDEDGVRKLDVVSVDGEEASDPEECGCGEDHDDLMSQDADDALRIFILKKKNK